MGGQSILPYLFAFIFFTKAIVLGLWITPLWDIPDETRHFNYARDLATGKGIPDRYNSPSDIDISSSLLGREVISPGDKNNWQAKHPPLYYIFAATAWKIASWLTDNPDMLFRAPRVVAAMAGTATLLVIYYLMLFLTKRQNISLAVMASVSFIPMFSNLSAGTNHDTTVTLFVSIATFFWCRFLLQERIQYAYWSAFWLSLASFTKMTALVIAAAMMTIVVLELSAPWRARIKQIFILAAINLSFPGLWMIREYFKYENPLKATGLIIAKQSQVTGHTLNISFLEYLSHNSVIEQFFAHFWGLFGWSGRYAAPYKMHLIRISGEPLIIYYVITSLLIFPGIIYLLFYLKNRRFKSSNAMQTHHPSIASLLQKMVGPVVSSSWFPRIVSVVLGGVVFFFLFRMILPSTERSFQTIIQTGVFTAMSILIFLSALNFFVRMDVRARLSFYAITVFVFFAILLLWKLYSGYLHSGVARAIHGRYFFPLIPMILIGLLIPTLEKLKFREWPILIIAIALGITELYVYVSSVLPFFIVFYKVVP
jgi:hypothetical protein